jgi:hypothetical protein
MSWFPIVATVPIIVGALLAWTLLRAKMEPEHRWLRFAILVNPLLMVCVGAVFIAYWSGFQRLSSVIGYVGVGGMIAGFVSFWWHLRTRRKSTPRQS